MTGKTLFIVAATLALVACAETSEEAWVRRQSNRCHAMGASSNYDKPTATFECWRHAMARNPKLMFKETYR